MEAEDLMREAVKEGLEAMRSGAGDPFGAVVVRDGEIIARDHNRSRELATPLAHAELLAVNRALADLGADSLAGAAVYASGQPCLMCLSAMLLAGVGEVYYANTHRRIGYDPSREVRAACATYGAADANPEVFTSSSAMRIIHLPVAEAEALAVPFGT